MNGVTSVTDAHRPGQARRFVTPEAIAAVEAILKENRRVTVNEIAAHPDMNHGLAHRIAHDVLQFYLISSSLVFSPKAGFGRNQSPVRRPVWLWHTAF